jgi:hypothetical protein
MNRIDRVTLSLVALPFLIIFGTASTLLGDQVLFTDDFSDGSAKEWQAEIGEWYVGGESYCVADCGS